jgi:hypothetical protein
MLVCIGSRSIVVNNLAQIGVTACAVDNNLTLCQVGVGAISTKKKFTSWEVVLVLQFFWLARRWCLFCNFFGWLGGVATIFLPGKPMSLM